ncbi:MAG: hypothetical protein PHQ75_15195, partial [Thermoguttaceae bacterium]|nr:hypothetical protein [Thermoguttaceae bacterium]
MSSGDEFDQVGDGGEIWKDILDTQEEKAVPGFDEVLDCYIENVKTEAKQQENKLSADDDSPDLNDLMKHILQGFMNGPVNLTDGSDSEDMCPKPRDDDSDDDDSDDDDSDDDDSDDDDSDDDDSDDDDSDDDDSDDDD